MFYKAVVNLNDPLLVDRLKTEFKELKNDLLVVDQEVKSFVNESLDHFDRDFFNNELNRPLLGGLKFDVKNLTRNEIKFLVKKIKEALNQIGFKAILISLKRGRLKVLVEF